MDVPRGGVSCGKFGWQRCGDLQARLTPGSYPRPTGGEGPLSSGTRTGRRRPPEGGEGWAAHHCLTGDLVDSPATDLDAWMPELARLTARHGVFAVLGNHDRRAGADRVAAALARWSGWRLLRDEVATIEVAGARLHLVGLEERPEGRAADALPDLVARVPGGEPFVVLAHRPSVLPVAAAVGVPLVLAGHTHGGQLAVPGVPRLNVARLLRLGFEAGCYARDGTLLYVNRGLGTSGQRLRIGVPREISVLTLTAT